MHTPQFRAVSNILCGVALCSSSKETTLPLRTRVVLTQDLDLRVLDELRDDDETLDEDLRIGVLIFEGLGSVGVLGVDGMGGPYFVVTLVLQKNISYSCTAEMAFVSSTKGVQQRDHSHPTP
jgi:hypothetical protein